VRRGSFLLLGALAFFLAGFLTDRLAFPVSTQKASPHSSASGLNWDALAARPLGLPQVSADGVCPTSPKATLEVPVLNGTRYTIVHGEDPAYVVPGAAGGEKAEMAGKDRVQLMISPAYHDALLVRGLRLDKRSPIGFGDTLQLDGTTDGWYSPAGAPKVVAVPQDTPHTGVAAFSGQNQPTWNALRLPAGNGIRPGTTQPAWKGEGWRLFSWLQDPNATGCYAVQLDGPSLTSVVVFQI